MILPIYLYGQPVLRQATEPVSPDYPDLNKLIDNLFETLVQADGVGLAAPQVGLSIRLFVIDLSPLKEDNPAYANYRKVFVNPEILSYSSATCAMEEGCLSVPDIQENVVRSQRIQIRYQDALFETHEETFSDYEARVIQHEYDHLQGTMFTDRIAPIRKQLIKSKLNQVFKGKVRPAYRFKAL